MGERDVQRLLGNAGIVRHRGKIESTINNAKRARELATSRVRSPRISGPRAGCVDSPARITPRSAAAMATSPESIALAKDLKKRGWTFVGPTTMYAFMQAMGLVNDHVHECDTRPAAAEARSAFRTP